MAIKEAEIESGKTAALPEWDMTPYFPGLESSEFQAEFGRVISEVARLTKLCDHHGVRKTESLSREFTSAFDEVLGTLNKLRDDFDVIEAYIYSFVTTDSRNNLAEAKLSELESAEVELEKIRTRLTAWIGSMDVEGLIASSDQAKAHEFFVRKASATAQHQMSEIEEDLAATLSLAGSNAWAKLHGSVTSRLMVDVEFPDGRDERKPMSAVRGLAQDADPKLRESAYRAELASWETVEVPLAAAMNGLKGWGNIINARRGWKDSLEPVLHANNTDRETVEAMQAACAESFPDFRRYLKAKARILGKKELPWWDMFGPLGDKGASRSWSFSESADFVIEQFGTFSKSMADLAKRSIDERWVDAEPREGKRDGAFCMGTRHDESRVLMNFEPSFNSLQTLAHELGHAYHNVTLSGRTPLQSSTPMALAETASNFAQTIVFNAALDAASGAEKLSLLEESLQDSCQVVVDIHSRFLFEKGVFEGREKRDLSVEEMKELMLDSQRATYGDGLDNSALHPYMWAVKPHYYGATYYNWPYTFGLLFALGLYARFRQEPGTFPAVYDELLSSTGMFSAADLAGRFGMDVRSVDFWRSSLDICRQQIDEFADLAERS